MSSTMRSIASSGRRRKLSNQRRESYVGTTVRRFLAVTLLMAAFYSRPAGAFSFVGSSATLRLSGSMAQKRRSLPSKQAQLAPRATHMRFGVTSSVIETVAKGILNLALANPRQATVDCRVSSTAMDLVRGNLEQAKVDGLNWTTPMGLTMRTIALTLDGMKIVPGEVFRGNILFKCPAQGRAVLNLNAEDFGNFLVHPLMKTADLPSGIFEFRREGTSLDVTLGRATFSGVWRGQPVVMEACQPERFGRIYARVAQRGRLTDLGIQTLSDEMTRFFNTVVLDLDGTAVSFEDMHHGFDSSGEPCLRVTVGVVVHRLPNPENMLF